MTGGSRMIRVAAVLEIACLTALAAAVAASGHVPSQDPAAAVTPVGAQELPVHKIPIPGEAAEGYFSPDGKSMICNAKMADDKEFQVYTFKLDGTERPADQQQGRRRVLVLLSRTARS